MTRAEYRKMTRELARITRTKLIERSEELLRSGAFDLPSAENNYILPKAVIHSLCLEMAANWRPVSADGRALSSNLKHF